MSKEELLYSVEERVASGRITNVDELENYLMELKNRGILTKGQLDASKSELAGFFGGSILETNEVKTKKGNVGQRTPKTMEYAYSNVSAGFSKTGMLVLLAMSVPVLVGMIVLLNQ